MITTFKKWFESKIPVKKKAGTYVACTYTDLTARMLHQWASMIGVPNLLGYDEFHTTILYSRAVLPPEHHVNVSEVQMAVRQWKFFAQKMDIFKSQEGGNCLVVKLDAPELKKMHNELIDVGATHDFPDYQPHITLSYDVPDNYPIPGTPIFAMVPNKIYTEGLNP